MKAYKNFFYLVVIFFLASCGGGGSSSTPDQQEEPNQFPSHPLVWDVVTPESVGMSSSKLDQAFDYAFQDGAYTQAAVVIKDGKLVYERYRGILPGEKTTLSNITSLDSSRLVELFGNKTSDSYVTSWSSAK